MSERTKEDACADASPFRPTQQPPLLECVVPEAVTHVDATGLAALDDLAAALREEGTELSLARVKAPLRARLAEAGLSEIPLHPTVRAAVEAVV